MPLVFYVHPIFAGSLQFKEDFFVAQPVSGMQRYPAIAYAKGVYLVVWQEGHYGWGPPADTEIRVIRVSGEGDLIDKTSFIISNSSDFQENPVITTNGEFFFVVWQDFRNGRDYDIYAARITRDGKILDPEGIAVAKAAGNQCFPSVSFDGKNFLIAWMDNRDIAQSYHIRVARVDRNGIVLEPEGILVAGFDKQLLEKRLNSDNLLGLPMNSFPKIACKKDECFVGWIQKTHPWSEYPRFVYINTEPQIKLSDKILSIPQSNIFASDYGDRAFSPSLSIIANEKNYMTIYSGIQGKGGGSYFIVGASSNRTEDLPNVMQTIKVRPWKSGYKLSESASPYKHGFIVVWAEGNHTGGRDPIKFALKGATIDDDKITPFEILTWNDEYRGSVSISTGSGQGMLVYEKIDEKYGMRILGRIFDIE